MRRKKTVLLLGGSGLLGSSLRRELERKIARPDWREEISLLTPSHQELNVLDFCALEHYVSELEPDLIFNCVAHTQVDRAESEPEQAMLYNRDLPKKLGELIKGSRTFLVHYSTDFVFNGEKKTPYTPEDKPDPLCVYGASKLAGEKALMALDLENCAILRTAWLYGPGGRNFVRTILGVCGRNGEARVVDDQKGSPTYSHDLAFWSVKFAENPRSGIFHVVNSGDVTWHGLASEAARLVYPGCPVRPIKSAELNAPATRPAYSVLDNSGFASMLGLELRHWRDALHEYLGQYGFLGGAAQ
ncbi:MAG: dTDP-4-dehydrorhamnose reductase [Desulfovibrionaceae bacterium]|nr:dTDP-4-dehydrorhamnose reductase [Desulfovibrionaceae bacterium]